jgi:heme-degrading monooxygenase HmoA
MHARVTRSETPPDKVEEGIKRLKENVIPKVKTLEGFKGGYWLVDRMSGKGFGITLFENEAALRATEDAAAQLRSQAPSVMKITGVERYEVVAAIPVQGSVAAGRATTLEGSPGKVGEFIKYTNDSVIPAAKKMPGLKGGYWLIDRQSAKGFVVTLFESESALRASEDSAAQMRSQATQQLDVKFTGVERYEVLAQALAEPAIAGR